MKMRCFFYALMKRLKRFQIQSMFSLLCSVLHLMTTLFIIHSSLFTQKDPDNRKLKLRCA